MRSSIYLDHGATTPVAKEVVEVMLSYFSEHFGVASTEKLRRISPLNELSREWMRHP